MFYRMVNLVKLFTHSNGINFKIRIRQVWIQYLVLVKKKKTNFLGLKVTSFLYLLPFQYTTLKLVRETQKRRMKRLIIVKIRKGKKFNFRYTLQTTFQNPNLVVILDGKKKSLKLLEKDRLTTTFNKSTSLLDDYSNLVRYCSLTVFLT